MLLCYPRAFVRIGEPRRHEETKRARSNFFVSPSLLRAFVALLLGKKRDNDEHDKAEGYRHQTRMTERRERFRCCICCPESVHELKSFLRQQQPRERREKADQYSGDDALSR